MDRDAAWNIVTEFVKDPALRRHMLAVEAAMRFYATQLAPTRVEDWGLVGLLHDFDWEKHPTLEGHPAKGAPILRERGLDEALVRAILSHNTAGTGVEREQPIDFALLACDEITGLITAVTLVRPSKDIADVKVKSVKKKWKEKSFAAGVHRDEVEQAVTDFSRACFEGQLEFWQHVENVLDAMTMIAEPLALDGSAAEE